MRLVDDWATLTWQVSTHPIVTALPCAWLYPQSLAAGKDLAGRSMCVPGR